MNSDTDIFSCPMLLTLTCEGDIFLLFYVLFLIKRWGVFVISGVFPCYRWLGGGGVGGRRGTLRTKLEELGLISVTVLF